MVFDHPLLVAAKVGVLLLGAAISGVSFLSWRRTRARLMLYLSAAFALIALGSFAEGVLFEFYSWNLFAVSIVETVFVLAGLSIIVVLLRPRGVRG